MTLPLGLDLINKQIRSRFRHGIRPRLKLARLSVERKLYRAPISYREFRDALLRLGDWRGRPVWVQSSWNDLYNLRMRPLEIIELMTELVGPDGTLVMPAFPLQPDPARTLAIDTTPANTGLLCELFRRSTGVCRSIHIYSSVAALGPDARYLTSCHHLDEYPWGAMSPYGRLYELGGLMVGLGIEPLGLTPLHHVECALHHQVPRFAGVFPSEVTYGWRRRDGESGAHRTLVREGRIRPRQLVRHVQGGIYREFRLSNLHIQAAPAREAIDALKALALDNKTIYLGR